MFTYLAIILLTLTTLGFSLSHLLSSYFFHAKEQELIEKGKVLVQVVGQVLLRTTFDPSILNVLRTMESLIDASVWVVDRQGLIIAASQDGVSLEGFRLSSDDLQEVLRGRVIRYKGQSSYFSEPMLMIGLPVVNASSDTVVGAVFLHSPVRGVSQTINQVKRYLYLTTLLAVILAFALGLYLFRTISSPSVRCTAALGMAEEILVGGFRWSRRMRSDSWVGPSIIWPSSAEYHRCPLPRESNLNG